MARNIKPRKTTFSIQLEADLLRKVDALAEQQSRSRSNQIRCLLLERFSATANRDDVNRTEAPTEQTPAA